MRNNTLFKLVNEIAVFFMAACLIIITKIIGLLPWWSFVLPLILLGYLIKGKIWCERSFLIGFLAGFTLWYVANLYFDAVFNGIILAKVGLLFSLSKEIVIIVSGLMGGLLSGLSLHLGYSIKSSV